MPNGDKNLTRKKNYSRIINTVLSDKSRTTIAIMDLGTKVNIIILNATITSKLRSQAPNRLPSNPHFLFIQR